MALKGSAFMIMWHDIAAAADAEYNLWHTREHMPERLDHPGFLRSRRGVNRGAARQIYFTLYEGVSLETFVSPDYTRSLNHPTAWTQQVAPQFRNFLRVACSVVHTSGRGLGGGLITAQLRLPDAASETAAIATLSAVLDDIAESNPAITAVHLAAARPDFSDQKTSETRLRPAMAEGSFDLVALFETTGLAEAVAQSGPITQALTATGFPPLLIQSYDIAYTLERRDAA